MRITKEATCLTINQPTRCTQNNLGIVDYDVDRRCQPSKNPPVPGLDNTQPKIFPWRSKQILWVIQDHTTKVKEKMLGRKFQPPNDPPMLSLISSQPNFFPWKPKQLLWLVRGYLQRVKEEDVGRSLKPPKDPPMLSLNNSRHKIFS